LEIGISRSLLRVFTAREPATSASLHQRDSSRAVNLPLEDNPRVLASYWFDAPATWLINPTLRYSRRRHSPCYRQVTFLRLQFRYRVLPAAAAPHDATLSRGFLSPQRYPSTKSYQSRVLPSRVSLRPHTYHVPRRFAPLADSLVSFQPGALSGQRFQSLTRRRSSRLLSLTSPLAISTPEPRKQTLSLLTEVPPRN
jgi:hypothetical protein